MRNICLFSIGVMILMVSSCINKKTKEKLFSTIPLCNGLYREKFRVFSGGAYSAELYSDYLTDSITFRKYMGTHDERETIGYKCSGDTIIVEKASYEANDHIDILERKTFDLKSLKSEHKFE